MPAVRCEGSPKNPIGLESLPLVAAFKLAEFKRILFSGRIRLRVKFSAQTVIAEPVRFAELF